jgi:hypothetical protein
MYGLMHAVTHDWRSISWATIAAFGGSIALAWILVARLAGLRAAAFVVVGLIGSQALLYDTSLAYAVPWALLGWLAAGIAITGTPPRYGAAGAALLFAALARYETLILVGLIGIVLVGMEVGYRRGARSRPPRAAWLMLLAVAAIPIQAGHDWLLSGDPFFSQFVPVAASRGAPLVGPLGVLRHVANDLVAAGPMTILGCIGILVLIRRRTWVILVGLTAAGPGIVVFLVLLAARDIYISDRYYAPVELAVIVAAAFGFAALRIPDLAHLPMQIRGVRTGPTIAVVIACIVAAAVSSPFAPKSQALRATVRGNLQFHQNEADAVRLMNPAVAAIPGVHELPTAPNPHGRQPGWAPVMVPVLMAPQVAVDLHLPISKIQGNSAAKLTTSGEYPRPGSVIYHDRHGDRPVDAYSLLEVSSPTTTGSITIVPIAAEPAARFWVLSVESSGR